jgi:hypothetical protein
MSVFSMDLENWAVTEVGYSNMHQNWHVCPLNEDLKQVGNIEIFKCRDDAINMAERFLIDERCKLVRVLRKDDSLDEEIRL